MSSFVGTETGEALRAAASGNELLTRPLTVSLVSPISAQANGGTAAYIRFLGTELSKQGHKVSGVARIRTDITQNLLFDKTNAEGSEGAVVEHDQWKTQLIAPKSTHRLLLKNLLRLMTRPGLETVAINGIQAAYGDSIERAIPADTDLIHYIGTGWEMFSYAALAVARRRGIPFVVTPFVHPAEWGDSALDARLYNQADAVLVCSGHEQKHLESKGVQPALFRRIGIAPAMTVKGEGQRFREKYNLGDRPLVFFMGRRQEYKGYHALCRAMVEVVKAIPDACLMVAGPDVEPPYPQLPTGTLLDMNVLPDLQEKSDAMAACDVFCMPSSAEAFGIVYVEAWAESRPVVAGPAPAVQELVENGVNGYRVSQNPPEIAAALIPLLKDRELCARLGKAGYEKQQTHFTWDAVTRRHLEIFREALLRRWTARN
jgi:glycosyltransferase involved in cell wall biosynthesis